MGGYDERMYSGEGWVSGEELNWEVWMAAGSA